MDRRPGASTLSSVGGRHPGGNATTTGKQSRVEAAQAAGVVGPTPARSGASAIVQPEVQNGATGPASTARGGRLGELIAIPAPALSDPVVPYLLALPLPTLLDELADAVQCGYALPLEARLATAPPILSAALQAASLARYARLTPAHPALARTGAALDKISLEQQVGILDWLLTRRGVSIQATSLVEGAIAIREGEARDGHERATEGSDIGPHAAIGAQSANSGMPTPVEEGPWAPPGDQPGGLYVGTDVHDSIGRYYRGVHRLQDVVTNDTPIKTILKRFNRIAAGTANASTLDEDELSRRPDILNLDLRHLYEIKPEAARDQGRAKAVMYTEILAKAGISVTLGPMGDPGANGQLPAPAGTVMFECVEPGVITYQYRHSRLVPVPVPAPATKRSRDWKWAFEADLTPEQRAAMVTTTIGGAVLVLLMVVLAPVGI